MLNVQRTYTPKPGAGGMVGLLKTVPEVKVYRKFLGSHGIIVTTQEWESIEVYNNSRNMVRQTTGITSVFGQIYPLLDSTHVTEILESV